MQRAKIPPRPPRIIMNKHIKFLQVNKGNSEFHNKIDQLKLLIEKHRPAVMIINELNLDANDRVSR